jgi:hypothetical protein
MKLRIKRLKPCFQHHCHLLFLKIYDVAHLSGLLARICFFPVWQFFRENVNYFKAKVDKKDIFWYPFIIMTEKKVAIKAENISKTFRILASPSLGGPHEKISSLRGAFVNLPATPR